MEEKREDSLLDRLRSGEEVQCEQCKHGYYIPYNAPADKAHYFNCSNPNCDASIHWDPIIEIE